MTNIVENRWSIVLLVIAFGGIANAAERRPPNVLVLVADDQRPDTIGGLGNPHIRTPHLDRLAKEGTVFTRAICANPICTPSRAEILTGCSGFRNGVLDFGGRIDPELTPWAAALRNAGYHTCYVGKWHNNGRPSDYGYAESRGLFSGGGGRWWKPQKDHNGRDVTGYRGWVFQTDDRELKPELGVGLTADISTKFADAAIQLIEQTRDKPFFAHVNFTAPHDPLLMPPGYAKMYAADDLSLPANFLAEHPFDHGNFRGRDEMLLPFPRTKQVVLDELAVYYAVISHMDEQIGRIIAALQSSDQMENTIIVFTSDHGLGIGSHGLRGKQSMYDHTIGVPLILRGPGIPAGRRTGAQIYLRDLYPTICDLVDAEIPPTVDGVSAVAAISGDTPRLHREVFGYFRNYQRMIRTDRWKLIHYPQIDRFQLFDLNNDPQELSDLSTDKKHAKTRQELARRLLQWQRSVEDPLLDPNAKKTAADKVSLGMQLFFDTRLSGDNQMSCATCHIPEKAFTDGLARAKGRGGKPLGRNTQTVLNTAGFDHLFWDGRATSLEQQALVPIQSADEMNQPLDELVLELKQIPGYVAQFKAVFGKSVTQGGIARALAAFQRTLVSGQAPYDRYLAGDKRAMTDAAIRGMELFNGEAGCSRCHSGNDFSDGKFYRIGVSFRDNGRGDVTNNRSDNGKFRTPTLRNVAETAPYMHDGSMKTLNDVVAFYFRGVPDHGPRSMELDVEALSGLSYSNIFDVVEFLKALSGELPDVQPPELP